MIAITRRLVQTLPALLALAALLCGRASWAVDAREVLATGDGVPGFGRIGEGGFRLLGLIDDGRALVHADVSDGRQGLFWVAPGSVTMWRDLGAATASGERLLSSDVRVSPNGTVAMLGIDAVGRESIYLLEGDRARPVAHIGQTDALGDVLCRFEPPTGLLRIPEAVEDEIELAVNDAGQLAFAAWVARDCSRYDDSGVDENGSPPDAALYVTVPGGLRRVDGQLTEGTWFRLAGIAADGTTLFVEQSVGTRERLVAARDGTARVFLDPAAFGLATPGHFLELAAVASPAGEVMFRASEDGARSFALYRTDHGTPRHIGPAEDFAAWGITPDLLFPEQLNARGDALIEITLSRADRRLEDPFSGFALIRDGRAPRALLDDDPSLVGANGPPLATITAAAMNASGTVVIAAERDTGSVALSQWSDAGVEQWLVTGDPAPGGGIFAANGLGAATCLAPDGSVASAATTVSDDHGLVCSDASGPRLVVRAGDPAPEGGFFRDFLFCKFVQAGEILFAASRSPSADRLGWSGSAVYRAGPRGIERVVGTGDRASDGSVFSLSSPYGFSAGPGGHVVVASWAESDALYSLRGGPPEVILKVGTPVGDRQLQRIAQFTLTERDELVFTGSFSRFGSCNGLFNHQQAVLRLRDGRIEILTDACDDTLLGVPLLGVWHLQAAGHHAIFSVDEDDTYQTRMLILDLDAPAGTRPRELLPAGEPALRGGTVETVWLLPNGHALARFSYTDDDGLTRVGHLRVDLDGGTPPTEVDLGGLQTIAANARGDVLQRARASAQGAARAQLALLGPAERGAGCPTNRTVVPASPPIPTATPTPTPTFAPTRTPRPTRPSGLSDVTLAIDSVTVAPGGRADLRVVLDDGGHDVAGIQIDIGFPPVAAIARRGGASADCRVNPSIDKESTFFNLVPNRCQPFVDCVALRALVVSIQNVDPILDGAVLFTCTLAVDAETPAGRYQLTAANLGASTPSGVAIDTVARGGEIVVTQPTDDAAQKSSALDSSGCQLAPGSAGAHAGWFLLPLAWPWLAARRRRFAVQLATYTVTDPPV